VFPYPSIFSDHQIKNDVAVVGSVAEDEVEVGPGMDVGSGAGVSTGVVAGVDVGAGVRAGIVGAGKLGCSSWDVLWISWFPFSYGVSLPTTST
jgi:hypothetical protein